MVSRRYAKLEAIWFNHGNALVYERDTLTILVDQVSVYRYLRPSAIPGRQRGYLDDMDQGIVLSGRDISQPDQMQRQSYVIMKLVQGLEEENAALLEATCCYLHSRFPELCAINLNIKGDEVSLEIIDY